MKNINKTFKKLNSCSSFQIKKIVYELTNGFEIELLIEFINEYNDYYFELFKELHKDLSIGSIEFENEKGINEVHYVIDKDLRQKIFESNGNVYLNEVIFTFYSYDGIEVNKELFYRYLNNSIDSKLKDDFFNIEKVINIIENIIHNKNININKNFIVNESDYYDLSDTTATEKIIYLHKLGVIDFLRKQQPFQSSINSLATVLSAVTGAKSGTIQPMLNAMLGKNVEQKNNPLNSQKPVDKVIKQLNQIGFNLDETI